MAAIDIISASAGSGKTHTLATLLQQEIEQGRVEPEKVIATTFTNRAAAELQERVRRHLLAAGLVDQAQRILSARFGTVNSVCGRLLSEFAFELGLSPTLKVIDEVRARHLLRQALDGVLTRSQEDQIAQLMRRWELFKPSDDRQQFGPRPFGDVLQVVVDLARSNRLAPPELAGSARRSLETFSRFLSPTTAAHATLERDICEKLEAFCAHAQAVADRTGPTTKLVGAATQLLRNIGQGQGGSWNDWVVLEAVAPGKASRPAHLGIQELAREHLGLPRLREDIGSIIGLLFDLAREGLARYQELKARRGLIDFTDQETFALQLLESDEVRRRLAGQIDLVVVDEFQDTSPLQLAIFLRLAEISRRSVWVGDQKQAIYGFRGTDPALMDAAMKAILGSREPATLKESYRSRPELVRLTSALFAPAFAGQGIPEQRVVLAPHEEGEPAGLGQILERWVTDGTKGAQSACIAAGVSGLLVDEPTLVRDSTTKEARQARAGDIAVLCRTNDECQEVAAALEAVGLRVARARAGLFDTHEGCLMLAGLRLWVDPGDRLARARVQRLVEHADRPDEWLALVLGSRAGGGAIGCDALMRLEEAREQAPLAGALTVFDLVCRVFEVRDLCLAWGDAPARLANLEALRELAVRYVEDGALVPGGASPGGLVAYLEQAQELREAEKPAVVDENAVVVSTWHSAKGLEWPIVVLHGIASARKAEPFSPRIASEAAEIDLGAPLAGRWIRYWPFPYHPGRGGGTLVERVEAHEDMEVVRQQVAREQLRLLYVIWTRARDRLVLACKAGELTKGIVGLLEIISEPGEGPTVWAGREVQLCVKQLAPLERREREPEVGAGYPPPESGAGHPKAWISPSDLHDEGAAGRAGAVYSIGKRIALRGQVDMIDLGHAVHGFLAADRPDMPGPQRLLLAQGLLGRWNVAGVLQAEDLLRAADALQGWIGESFPGARPHREVPIEHRHSNGSVVRGTCDLALETDSGFAVVDHKSFPGGADEALERVGTYAPQLWAYAAAIEAASGKIVSGCFIHLPLLGQVVQIEGR